MQGLKPGDKLPTIHELCRGLGVSHQTITKALDDLDRDGVIYRIQGKGTLVRPTLLQTKFDELKGFSKTMKQQGVEPKSRVLNSRTIHATPKWNAIFMRPPESQMYYVEIVRLRIIDDTPAVLNRSILPLMLGQKLLSLPLENRSFFELFEQLTGSPVVREDHLISLEYVALKDAKILQVEAGSAHFRIEGITYLKSGEAAEWSSSLFRSDRFQLRVRSFNVISEPRRKP